MNAPDTPSAALAGIRADLAHLRACADAIPVNPEAFDLEALMLRYARAVAALEAVLKLADDWEEGSFRLDVGTAVMDGCARELREAITSALTGEERSDERT